MDRTEGAKKNSRRRAGAVHGHQRSGQGHFPERANCKLVKLVKKNLIRPSARLSGELGGEAMSAPGSSYRDVL
jgi:hypothetical protein